MENISIDTIYSLLDKFDIFNELLTRYGTALLIAAAVFALLNCFFGYALRKLWSVLLGFGIGASGGMLLTTYTDQNFNMTLGVTLGLGFIFGLLALLLYRIGTFFLIIGFLGFSLYKLLNPTDLIMLLFLLGIAVVIALIGVPFERITVILITSVCGALTAVTLAYDFQETDYDLVMWMIVRSARLWNGFPVQALERPELLGGRGGGRSGLPEKPEETPQIRLCVQKRLHPFFRQTTQKEKNAERSGPRARRPPDEGIPEYHV